MNRTLTALGTSFLLGGSLLLGAGPASAGTCQAGYHWNDLGNGAGWCAENPSGGGTGGAIVWDGGGQPQAPVAPPEVPPQVQDPGPTYAQAPPYRAPQPQAPAYHAPQAQTPPYRAPAAGAYTPVAPAAGGYAAAAPGQQVAEAARSAGAAVPAEATAATPASRTAAIALPVTEAQAVDTLRSGTATRAAKDTAARIIKARISAVLDQAISKASGRH